MVLGVLCAGAWVRWGHGIATWAVSGECGFRAEVYGLRKAGEIGHGRADFGDES